MKLEEQNSLLSILAVWEVNTDEDNPYLAQEGGVGETADGMAEETTKLHDI